MQATGVNKVTPVAFDSDPQCADGGYDSLYVARAHAQDVFIL